MTYLSLLPSVLKLVTGFGYLYKQVYQYHVYRTCYWYICVNFIVFSELFLVCPYDPHWALCVSSIRLYSLGSVDKDDIIYIEFVLAFHSLCS